MLPSHCCAPLIQPSLCFCAHFCSRWVWAARAGRQGRNARWIEMTGNGEGLSLETPDLDINVPHVGGSCSDAASETMSVEERRAEGGRRPAEQTELPAAERERVQKEHQRDRMQMQRDRIKQAAAYLWPSRSEASLVKRWLDLRCSPSPPPSSPPSPSLSLSLPLSLSLSLPPPLPLPLPLPLSLPLPQSTLTHVWTMPLLSSARPVAAGVHSAHKPSGACVVCVHTCAWLPVGGRIWRAS